MNKIHDPLTVNIGFIIHESPGFTRDFEFEFPHIELPPDLAVKDFKGKVTFSRAQKGILMEGRVSGIVPTNCVRCLEAILETVTSDFTELLAFHHIEDADTELKVPENGYIDLAPLVREYLFLDSSSNPLCKPDCAGLCPTCGINRNHEECDCKAEEIDPRLSKLKDLLDQDD